MSKKNYGFLWSLLITSVILIVVSLFVPIVHIVGHAADELNSVVYDKNVNFLTYIIDAPFFNTDAFDIYYNSTGPVWMATGAIMFNLLLCVGAIVLFILCLIDLISHNKNSIIRNNVLTKKIAYYLGFISIFVAIFSAVSFIVTNSMANGYMEFYVNACPFVVLTIGVLTIIFASRLDKRVLTSANKTRDSLGFAFTGLSTIVSILALFIPIYIEAYFPKTSIYGASTMASDLLYEKPIVDMSGDFAFGLVRFVCFGLFFIAAFIIIYAIIGVIRSLFGKKTIFLSKAIKRWSMALIIGYFLTFSLVLCQTAVLSSSFYFMNILAFTWQFFVILFIPIIPYITSTLIAVEKKQKEITNLE
ncbi:MAG: hypothetical protein K6F08_02335 [bacterium]|nr:hypothetical protein [bacterium]